jgi:hypothetical protein
MLHEADGTAALIRGILAANIILVDSDLSPVGSKDGLICARVAAVHDTPSLGGRLPFEAGTPLGAAAALFFQCDSLAMMDFGAGLKNEVPLGPMVEIWTQAGDWHARDKVAAQAVKSVESLRSRMRAAFGLPPSVPLPDCFPNLALRDAAYRCLADWQAELDVDLRAPAGWARRSCSVPALHHNIAVSLDTSTSA